LAKSSSAEETLAELDLLLTGGRLGNSSIVTAAYNASIDGDPLEAAQKAILLTPEFNMLGNTMPLGQRPVKVPQQLPSSSRSYKALVKLYFAGGADTWNLLVPYTDCHLYKEYQQVRGLLALEKRDLLKISAQGQGQPCDAFGVHGSLPFIQKLYEKGKAAFVSNIGSLVEPLTKDQVKSTSGRKCQGLFSHSDQVMSHHTLKCQVPGSSPRGAGGRLADSLARGLQQYRTMSFSVAGQATWSHGFQTHIEIIDQNDGARKFDGYQEFKMVFDDITSVQYRNTLSEEYVRKLGEAIVSSEKLAGFLQNVTLNTVFPQTTLGKQLYQVARLIATQADRKSERDFFFVQLGGFDTHGNQEQRLREKFVEVNDALESFVTELEQQGVFNSVALVTGSDFGRTLSTNGAGTDHAWAGNHFVVGGDIEGGRVFNTFPTSLLPDNEQDAGRGRMIPSYPWESVEVPVAEWMGMEQSQRSTVFPNVENFDQAHIIQHNALFRSNILNPAMTMKPAITFLVLNVVAIICHFVQ